MKSQAKMQLSLVAVVGDKKAKELLEAVSTYKGWKMTMLRDRTASLSELFKGDSKDTLGVKNAYKAFSKNPHPIPERYLKKIIDLKNIVAGWISTKLAEGKNPKDHPRLQTMLALQEHLAHRQQQVESHLNQKQEREKLLKMSFHELHAFFTPASWGQDEKKAENPTKASSPKSPKSKL